VTDSSFVNRSLEKNVAYVVLAHLHYACKCIDKIEIC